MASNSSHAGEEKRKSGKISWAVKEGKKQRRKGKKMGKIASEFKGPGILNVRELAQRSSDDIAQMLDQDLKRFQHTLNKCENIRDGDKNSFIEATIEIMRKLSHEIDDTDLKASSNTIIAEFLSDRCAAFHIMLKVYVQTVDVQHSLMPIQKLCDFCKVVSELFRNHSQVLPIRELAELDSLPQNLSEQMQSLAEMQKEFTRLQRQKQSHMNSKHSSMKQELTVFEDWDDSQFRNLPILPTVKEIIGKPPPLRSNIIKGSYNGWEHYYDVQFRLLREDFVAPLRRGIAEFCNPNRKQRLTEVYIYNNVYILSPVCTHAGLCFNIVIDLKGLNLRRNLLFTKRLMFGSLLCFTPISDNFQNTVHFAVVTNRDPRDIRKGIVQVMFEESLEMLQHVEKTTFIVAESRAFFEASRHVLQSLQTAEVDTMPFTRYLVLNDPLPLNHPKYLDKINGIYNLRAVYKNDCDFKNDVKISDANEWPNSTDPNVELDQSQLDAIKMALTQEIAIIQGPPGTGKTYIGYKIVQTLLENRQVWDPHKLSPILVMCFTNHALDQFLEGIIHHEIQEPSFLGTNKRSPKIVRIGGRSKSDEIMRFNLRNVRRNLVPRCKYKEVQDTKSSCLKFGSHIAWKIATLKEIVQIDPNIVIGYNMLRLKYFIQPSHFYQITQLAEKDEYMMYSLEIWLGMWEKVPAKYDTVERNKNNHPLELTNSQDSDEEETTMVNIIGEGEAEEETRKLDMDNYMYSPITAQETQNKDDTVTNYIKSRSKRKLELQNQAETTYEWKRKNRTKIDKIFNDIRKVEPMEEYSDIKIPNITCLSFTMTKRYQLLRLWLNRYEQQLRDGCKGDIATYDRMCKEWKAADQELDRIALEHAEVIGMTTTGAAKYKHIIHLVKPKIVIVEEAAELLESHIVSALNAGTQHLILIGDHKQLRPKPNEYDLAMKHNLHISLFERLITNGLPHATLMIQHRMRPQIASLVCPHIYDKLVNHESVTKYKSVKGFRKNMYFFHHEEEEEHNQSLLSHANEYEAKFIVALCRHLLKLGYEPSQVTILTAYSGQLMKMMKKMTNKEFEGVKITNVDNFQGEENDIIILSLVRSNTHGSVGFLKEENRVCVALSRARMGLFCFGNFNKLLRVEVPIWDRILTQVDKEGCLGSAFPLQCPNHDDVVFDIHKPEEFAKHAPEGGCGRPCEYRLECGHTCKRLCHADDLDHKLYKCKSHCTKMCEKNEHHCGGYCYETPCPPCAVKVKKGIPSCGHKQWMKCSDDPCFVNCETPCEKLCPKGIHKCPLLCSDICEECKFRVKRKMPKCGHEQTMLCYQKPENIKCKEICNKVICKEGHRCPKLCSEECGSCEEPVTKQFAKCGHFVELPCHVDPANTSCKEVCRKIYKGCKHQCSKTCGEDCDPVCMKPMEKMIPKCGHIQEVPCFQLPENWCCQKPCRKKLRCGHTCQHKCGEPCLEDYECEGPREFQLPCKHTITIKCKEFHMIVKMKLIKPEGIPCPEPCNKLLKCGHRCKNKCSEPCLTECQELETKTCLKGVHSVKVTCGEIVSACEEHCKHKLPCGHFCSNKCSEPCIEQCSEIVYFECLCGHKHKSKCQDRSCKCEKKCQTILECGHNCSGRCGECFTTRLHAICPFELYINRFCGHYARVPCFGLEDNCCKSCQLSTCLHASTPCKHKCHQPCDTVCTEPCLNECPHRKCTQPCCQQCDVPPCNESCSKTLDCGHQCLGVCGEECLTKCIECDETEFQAAISIKSERFLQSLQYIELECGHLFSVKYLDDYFQSQLEETHDRLVSPPLCPTCQRITTCSRYERIFRVRKMEINSVKSEIRLPNEAQSIIEKCENILKELNHCYITAIDELNEFEHVFDIVRKDSTNEQKSRAAEVIFTLQLVTAVGKLCIVMKNECPEFEELAVNLLENMISISMKNKGHLSVQLISDIKRETFRINLLNMMKKVQTILLSSNETAKSKEDFDIVQRFMEQTKKNNSALSESNVDALVQILKSLYKQHSSRQHPSLEDPVNTKDFDITPSLVTKGEWYHCAKYGHYYFIPSKYHPEETSPLSCTKCKPIK